MINLRNKVTGLHLSIAITNNDLAEAAQLYASQNPEGFIPVDIQKSVIEFRKAIHTGAYVRLIVLDNKICGFIVGMLMSASHVSEKTVQQLYCYCSLEGLAAYRGIVLAHEGLISYAEGLKAKYVLSSCNQLSLTNNLAKILGTRGWEVYGYMALWKTIHHSQPSVPKLVR